MAKFKLFGEITKAEEQEDGTLVVQGIASTESPDKQGDIITAEAMRKALPEYLKFPTIREMHQSTSAAGTALAVEVDEENITKLEALVVDPVAIKKIQTGTYRGFSIGGSIPKDGGRDPKNKRIVRKINLTEISLVDRPANPDATFTLAKFDTGTTDEEDPMSGTAEDPNTQAPEGQEPVQKGMYDVSRFADLLSSIASLASGAATESGWEGDNSPVPEKLRVWLAAGGAIFQEMAAEEVAELQAGIAKQMGVAETVTAAAKADTEIPEGDEALEKKGARFSKATKDALGNLRKAYEECMKALALDDNDEDEEAGKAETSEALQKAAGLQDELTATTAQRDEALAKCATLEEELAKAEGLAKAIQAKLDTKGAVKVVPVSKAEDSGAGDGSEKLEKRAAEPATATDAILAAHRQGGFRTFTTRAR